MICETDELDRLLNIRRELAISQENLENNKEIVDGSSNSNDDYSADIARDIMEVEKDIANAEDIIDVLSRDVDMVSSDLQLLNTQAHMSSDLSIDDDLTLLKGLGHGVGSDACSSDLTKSIVGSMSANQLQHVVMSLLQDRADVCDSNLQYEEECSNLKKKENDLSSLTTKLQTELSMFCIFNDYVLILTLTLTLTQTKR
jgi:hypothetical protein